MGQRNTTRNKSWQHHCRARPFGEDGLGWPVIGGLIGAFSALLSILVLVWAGVDLSLAVLWVVAAQFLMTGALHEDGADGSADGLFVGA